MSISPIPDTVKRCLLVALAAACVAAQFAVAFAYSRYAAVPPPAKVPLREPVYFGPPTIRRTTLCPPPRLRPELDEWTGLAP